MDTDAHGFLTTDESLNERPVSVIKEEAMKTFFSLLLPGLLLLTGCARNYVVTLTNGTQLGAQGKPHLQGGSYHFKDARGQESSVAAGSVSQIEPASRAGRKKDSDFISSPR